ncbi:hypothetical protein [Euzebya sp.]|uniref:hypothetical protein n=1 Tax=Euzebya sp. TaxID=1971409 RepID=UPI003512FFBF
MAAATTTRTAEDRLADLEAELADLPAATTEARRVGDAAEWMRLLTRADELPGEVTAARVDVLAGDLAAAWAAVDEAAAVEAEARAVYEPLRDDPDCTPLAGRIPPSLSRIEAAEIELAYATAVTARDRAHETLKAASFAHDRALAEVDAIEAALVQLGADPADHGSRPAPPPLASQARVSAIGAVPKYDPTVAGRFIAARSETWTDRLTLPAGTVPPRWLARHLTHPSFGQHVPA